MIPTAEALLNAYDTKANDPEADFRDLALLARELDAVIDNLQVIRKTVGTIMADNMEGKALIIVGGIGPVERVRWTRWEPHDKDTELTLVRHVAASARGGVRSPTTAARRAGEAIAQAASLTWRTTQLKTLGIDVPFFLNQKHGDWSVKIPKE